MLCTENLILIMGAISHENRPEVQHSQIQKPFIVVLIKKKYLLSVAVCLAWLGLICKVQKKLELGTDEAMARM
jgi:hypothetical protein